MKIQTLIFLALCTLFLTNCTDNNGVKVKFYNETGFDIENLRIGNVEIGDLENYENTGYIYYDKFGFDTGMPDENCEGYVVSQPTRSFNIFYWCGTEKTNVEEGVYEMTINLVEYSNGKYFRLELDE